MIAPRSVGGYASLLTMAPLLLALVLGLRLDDRATCPSAADVQEALRAVGDPVDGAGALAQVEVVPQGVRVRLQPRHGEATERILPSGRSCAALAQAAAVTLAIWDARLGGPGALTPVLPRLPDELPPTASWLPPLHLELGLGIEAAQARTAVSAGEAFLWVTPAEHALGLAAATVVESARAAPLASGEVIWTRQAVGLGAVWQKGDGPWKVALSSTAYGGGIEVRGVGFAENRSVGGPELGLDLAARLVWSRYPVAPWVGIRGLVWFLGQEAYADGTPRTVALSPVEGWAGAGLLVRLQ